MDGGLVGWFLEIEIEIEEPERLIYQLGALLLYDISIHATHCLIPEVPPLWRHDSALVKAGRVGCCRAEQVTFLCLTVFLPRSTGRWGRRCFSEVDLIAGSSVRAAPVTANSRWEWGRGPPQRPVFWTAAKVVPVPPLLDALVPRPSSLRPPRPPRALTPLQPSQGTCWKSMTVACNARPEVQWPCADRITRAHSASLQHAICPP
ncbi:hypothetical protein EDB80DRAFT_837679 [Ilyonectria destructans]|nr:hypothetical protein EDB80DRAFT_837679 [Ilyonectria destructans]